MSRSTTPPLTASRSYSPDNQASKAHEDGLSSAPGRQDAARALPPQLGHVPTFDDSKRRRVASGDKPFFPVGVSPARSDKAGQCSRIERLKAAKIARMAWQHVDQYLELDHLADPSVSVTQEAAGGRVPANSYSSILGKRQHFVEYERSLLSLRCLNLLIDGSERSHKEWIAPQSSKPLEYASFRTLSDQWGSLVEHYAAMGIHPDELKEAAEVALVLGDMGKVASVRTMMAELGITDADHDDFYAHVMRTPDALALLPSFQRLRPELQDLLRKTADLAHFGHITHGEGGSGMFSKLKQSDIPNRDPAAFEFAVFVHRCDVAGALGHRKPLGSMTLTEETFRTTEEAYEACRRLKEADEVGAYESLLRTRAEWLGLSPLKEEDRMLARLGAMLRLTTAEQGKALKEGFELLSDSERKDALDHLSIAGADKLKVTPTYVPAVFANSLKLGIPKALKTVVPFVTSALAKYKAMVAGGEIPADLRADFNHAAGVAANDPTKLVPQAVQIDRETGKVMV